MNRLVKDNPEVDQEDNTKGIRLSQTHNKSINHSEVQEEKEEEEVEVLCESEHQSIEIDYLSLV